MAGKSTSDVLKMKAIGGEPDSLGLSELLTISCASTGVYSSLRVSDVMLEANWLLLPDTDKDQANPAIIFTALHQQGALGVGLLCEERTARKMT